MAGLSLAQRPAANGGPHAAAPGAAVGAVSDPAEALKAAQAALSGIMNQRPPSAHQPAAVAAAAGPGWQQQRPPAPQHLPSPQHLASPGQACTTLATVPIGLTQLNAAFHR